MDRVAAVDRDEPVLGRDQRRLRLEPLEGQRVRVSGRPLRHAEDHRHQLARLREVVGQDVVVGVVRLKGSDGRLEVIGDLHVVGRHRGGADEDRLDAGQAPCLPPRDR